MGGEFSRKAERITSVRRTIMLQSERRFLLSLRFRFSICAARFAIRKTVSHVSDSCVHQLHPMDDEVFFCAPCGKSAKPTLLP